MNVEKLRQLQVFFKEHPQSLDMNDWAHKHYSCGTVGCIAGWAVMMSLMKEKHIKCDAACNEVMEKGFGQSKGRELLEITDEQSEQLFFVRNWPEDLAEAYNGSAAGRAGDEERAAATIERIERFIQSDGEI